MLEHLTERKPKRIQRKREKGWKMPEGAVYVGRPTIFGNPWTVKQYMDAGYGGNETYAARRQVCVDAFRAFMRGEDHWAHAVPMPYKMPDVASLRGKDLVCWCPLDQPCHADVLLDIANA